MWELGIGAAVVLALLVVLGFRLELGTFLRQMDRAPSPARRGFLARIRRRVWRWLKHGERQD
jgi:hypothetical protein